MTESGGTAAGRALAMLADEAVQMTRQAGWDVELLPGTRTRVSIRVGSHRLPREAADSLSLAPKSTPIPMDDSKSVRVDTPAVLALSDFAGAVGATGGGATVLAPVGGYGAPTQVGLIDAVAVSPCLTCLDIGGSPWHLDVASVGHSRCWILSATAFADKETSEKDVANGIDRSARLFQFPDWGGAHDTARLCEYMRDRGWDDGRFPMTAVLSTALTNVAGKHGVQCWLAVTEARSAASIAEAVAAIAEPDVDPNDHWNQFTATRETLEIAS